MLPTSLHELVRSEFSCWFMIEELPEQLDDVGREFLKQRAENVVYGILENVDDASRETLIRELKAASADPGHPLIEAMSDGSNVDWNKETLWPMLQIILKSMLEGLAKSHQGPRGEPS